MKHYSIRSNAAIRCGARRGKGDCRPSRRGSTLLIVLALLSILSFMGMVFYTISSQERAAAEYFSEAAKVNIESPDDPFPFGLRQLIIGPNDFEKVSILHSPSNQRSSIRRHSLVANMVGTDIAPFTGGGGVNVIYPRLPVPSEIPAVDQNYDDTADTFSNSWENPLNFVDSLAAWGTLTNEGVLREAREDFPAPDVPYTYPDINHLFLGFKGWAIRDNGSGISEVTLRYERVPVIIPSFFRPALMKSGTANGFGGTNTLTDYDWYDAAAHPVYGTRSMRPHPSHIAGYNNSGAPIRRFLDPSNPADTAIIAALPGGSGGFPFRPGESGNSTNFGRLGIWTGHAPIDTSNPPLADDGIQAQFADNFELDSDNDFDGIREGIWMDLSYPIETTTGGVDYTTLFSFTILDLDSLIDLNVHGNLARLDRTAAVPGLVGTGNQFATESISASNQGLSPTEINPLYALFPPTPGPTSGPEFLYSFGANPFNRLEQANMELLWLTTGRIHTDGTVHAGKWGDEAALWYYYNGGAGRVWSLPRPGRSGNLAATTTARINFGGHQGFDDNQNVFEGIAATGNGRVRGFVHPLDVSGRGRIHNGDHRIPNMFQDDAAKPDRWLRYDEFTLTGDGTGIENDSPYVVGRDQTHTSTADNLVDNPSYNFGLDDAAEVIFDVEQTLRPDDAIYGPADMVPAHLVGADITSSQTSLSTRLADLAPFAFDNSSDIRDRFTTLTSSLRQFPFGHQLGPNMVSNSGSSDDGPRWWEWTSDFDNDGKPEFPPQFGTVLPYSAKDPFRAVVRRLLTTEVGDPYSLIGQLPLSVNHILDVNRTSNTPLETSTAFLANLLRSGMRFRTLTEHPDADEADGSGSRAAAISTLPTASTARASFPPRDFGDREFWARRDRQQLCRDIYVLLYTLGGGEVSAGNIVDYTSDNSMRARYTNEQLRRMAQFAVNMVDAMDTDNVITRFEYDKNLNNGWDLDDDASTDDGFAATTDDVHTAFGMYPEDSDSERGVVYGVEAQQLAFSEALSIYSEELPPTQDMSETAHNDESGHRVLLHFELQNMQPYPVTMALPEVGTANEDFAIWRFLRVDRDGAAKDRQDDTPNFKLSVMDGNGNVAGGDLFTVGVASLQGTPGDTNPTGFGTADLYVDDDTDGTFHLISPDTTLQTVTIASGDTPLPQCTLDTVHTSHQSRFLANGTTTGGEFLEGVVDIAAPSIKQYQGNNGYDFTSIALPEGGFEIVLQRRMNPNLPQLPLTDNPFVEVDRIRVPVRRLIDASGPTIQLDELQSVERTEPLNATIGSARSDRHATVSATNRRRNTIGSVINDATDMVDSTRDDLGRFSLWQPHFDRDFASVAELMQLPLVPPRLLTQRLDRMRFAPFQQLLDDPRTVQSLLTNNPLFPELASTSESLLLQPEFAAGALVQFDDDNDPGTAAVAVTAGERSNRWYRLLQFVEVPSRLNRMLGNYLSLRRLPGKMNVNTVRHLEAYAGLIDDTTIASVPYYRIPGDNTSPFDQDNRYFPFLRDSTPGIDGVSISANHKDRWFELCSERDGKVTTHDAVHGGARDFWIPGTPNAKPFKPLGSTAPDFPASGTDNLIQETILRTLSNDTGFDVNRTLLEIGGADFHKNPGNASSASNGTMRNQVLSKIIGNTTTTSNCFIVYATAAYFEVYADPGSGLYRIGGRLDLDGDPLTSGISSDTSTGWEKRAVFLIDRTEAFNAFDPASGSFDWSRLVKYRADLATDGQ